MKHRVVAILSMALMTVSLAGPAHAASPCLIPAAVADALPDGWPPCTP